MILWFRGLLAFAAIMTLPLPGPKEPEREVPDARDLPHKPEAPPAPVGGGGLFRRR